MVRKIENNRKRNGYIKDTLTSVDNQETVKIGGKVFQIYEGVIYQENFKISPFEKIIEKLFALRKKYKDEKNDLMQCLVKLVMNSLCGVQVRKDINKSFYCLSQHWMKTEGDENVLDYLKLTNRNYIVKIKEDDELDDDCDFERTLHGHQGAFVLNNSNRIMNYLIREINGFYINNIYYTKTDSLYLQQKYWDVLDEAKLVGEKFVKAKMNTKVAVYSTDCF